MIQVTFCTLCSRYSTNEADVPVCEAFPYGIPEEISRGGFDHRQAAPDDHGIRFDPAPGVTPVRVERLAQELAKQG